MKIEVQGETLRVSEVEDLSANTANAFRNQVRRAFEAGQKNIEIDLAQTRFLDSCGLGALIALHKSVSGRAGRFRLLNPQPPVQQLLDLTRMHRIFEIVKA